MPVVHKIGTANTDGGSITTVPQSTVIVNGVSMAVNGSRGTADGSCSGNNIHCAGNWATANGCLTVRINSIPVNRSGDRDTCGHPRADIGGNVFVCAGNGGGVYIDHNPPIFANPASATDPTHAPPAGGQTEPQPGYENITKADVQIYDNNNDDPDQPAGPAPDNVQVKPDTQQVASDPTPPPALGSPSAPPVGSPGCSVIEALPASFTWTSVPGSPVSFTDYATSTVLSPNFTVASLTISTAVSRYEFSSSVTQANGSSQKEILQNLCYHTSIILEPLLADGNVPPFTITSGFRNKSGSSQHNKGQATDLQFLSFHGSGSTGTLYYNLAQYIRDNFNYDQMILEWFGRNPWIHISSNRDGHRGNVLTQVARTSYQPGLIQLG